MTPNRRKLKRRIKPPKRYEGFVSAFIKRNDSDHDTSNDENSKEDMRNKAMNVDEVCLDQNGLETGEIVEGEKKGKEIEENLGGNGLEIGEIKEELVTKSNSNGQEQIEVIGSINNEDVPIIDKTDINEGINKNFTICGYFIGQNMSFYELRYHVRRMWGKFALKDVIVNATGVNLFKFKDEKGIKSVLEQGPWLEYRRSDCARVLVGIEAKKELKDVIKIEYIGKNEHVKGTKEVAVMTKEEEKERMEATERAKKSSGPKQTENFIEVQHRKRNVQNQRRNWQTKNQWEIDRLKEQEDQGKNVEDVYENKEGIAQTMTVDNVSGLSEEILH
ncbi:hypothetical protein Tco_0385763 [Tanacetum coccineum]